MKSLLSTIYTLFFNVYIQYNVAALFLFDHHMHKTINPMDQPVVVVTVVSCKFVNSTRTKCFPNILKVEKDLNAYEVGVWTWNFVNRWFFFLLNIMEECSFSSPKYFALVLFVPSKWNVTEVLLFCWMKYDSFNPMI